MISESAAELTISARRRHVLRVPYIIMAIGLAVVVWPYIISHDLVQAHSGPASQSMLAALGLLSVIGIFKPVKMLPLLLFEILWKFIFMISFALPLIISGTADSVSWENIWACITVVIFFAFIPWRFVLKSYFIR